MLAACSLMLTQKHCSPPPSASCIIIIENPLPLLLRALIYHKGSLALDTRSVSGHAPYYVPCRVVVHCAAFRDNTVQSAETRDPTPKPTPRPSRFIGSPLDDTHQALFFFRMRGVRHFILHRAVTLLAPYYAHTSTYSASPNQPPRIASRVPHPVLSHLPPCHLAIRICTCLPRLAARICLSKPSSALRPSRHLTSQHRRTGATYLSRLHPRPTRTSHTTRMRSHARPHSIAGSISPSLPRRISPSASLPSSARAVQDGCARPPTVPSHLPPPSPPYPTLAAPETLSRANAIVSRFRILDARRGRRANRAMRVMHARRTEHGQCLGRNLDVCGPLPHYGLRSRELWNARPRSELCGLGLGCHRLGLGQGAGHDDDRWSSQDAGHLRVERHAVRAGWRHRTRMNGRPGKARTMASREEAQTRCDPPSLLPASLATSQSSLATDRESRPATGPRPRYLHRVTRREAGLARRGGG
ncbi:hypothetical protein C8Q76DRAFT_146021 [Earliella scabrosa]|nr:hypothetical protein C8Q76DRAFT_146021 [Earliella scabrosa]